jgi:predicted transcriptional regulator
MPSTSTSTTPATATQKLLKYLLSGHDITPGQARSRFGITNVSARVSEIRRAGFAVYCNEKKTPKGDTITVYQLGRPTRRMVSIANLVLGNPEKYADLIETANESMASQGVQSR